MVASQQGDIRKAEWELEQELEERRRMLAERREAATKERQRLERELRKSLLERRHEKEEKELGKLCFIRKCRYMLYIHTFLLCSRCSAFF